MSLRCESHRLIPRVAIERFQEWVYQTSHPVEALVVDNYFLAVGDRLVAGDVIEAYATGLTRTHHLRLHVVSSGRNAVVVAPFVHSHDIGEACVQFAPFGMDRSRRHRNESRLELSRLSDGTYRIVDIKGDVVVGGIKGHEFGVALFGRISAGKISVPDARRAVEKAEFDALLHAEQRD